MEESVLLGTTGKPLVDSIRHFIWDPCGVFSVCHLCQCRIVQLRHDSRLFALVSPYNNFPIRTSWLANNMFIFSCTKIKIHNKNLQNEPVIRNRVISSYFMSVALSSPVKFSKIVFSMWSSVQSLKLCYKNNFCPSLQIN